MKLPKDSPLYKELPELTQTLPDLDDLEGLAGSALGRATLEAQWSFQDTQTFQMGSQIILGNIAANVGVPRMMFDAVTNVLSFDVQKAAEVALEHLINAFEDLTEQILTTIVNQGVGIAVNVTAAVPVVGWIVKAAWEIGKSIYNLVKLIQKSKQEFEALYPPSAFSPPTDLWVLKNLVVSSVRTKLDWSELFYPPGVGKSQSWQKPFGSTKLGVDNHKVGVRVISTNQSTDWVGFVPGTDVLHQSIELLNDVVTEVGATLYPSARKQCIWVWRHITETNVPAAFTVDAEVTAALWQTYIEDLRIYLRETDELSDSSKAKIFKFYNGTPGAAGSWSKIFGWGDGSEEKEYAPTQICNKLRDRQFDLLDTITCAYVDASFGAIKNNAQMKDRWQKRRLQLLEHPAVCIVDEDNIPDEDYRAEVISRRKHHQCLVGAYDFIATPKGKYPTMVPQGFPSLSANPSPPPAPAHSYKPLVIGGGLAALAYWQREAIMKFIGGLKR